MLRATKLLVHSAGLIPFIEKNYVYRSLMGSNQQRQAVPLIQPSAPIVGTGMEAAAARNTGQLILAEENGEVVKATAQEVIVQIQRRRSNLRCRSTLCVPTKAPALTKK